MHLASTKGTLTMDITVELKSLRPAVAAAKKLSARAYGNPGVTLTAEGGALKVTTSDVDVNLETTVPATVREGGTVTVSAVDLAGLVKGKGTVVLSSGQEGTLRVENGIVTDLPTTALPVAPGAEWDDVSHTVDLGTVGAVGTAASRDEARPILTGVLFDGACIVATDSYRLHLAEGVGAAFRPMLVPSRAFAFLPKTGAATMTQGKHSRPGTPHVEVTYVGGVGGEKVRTEHPGAPIVTDVVRIATDGATVIVRLIDGEFPNWRQLVPSASPHALTFEREAFLKVAGAVGATIAKTARPVRLEVQGSELVIFAHGEDGNVSSSGRVPCKGDDLELFPAIAFNPAFLVEAVATLDDDFATLSVTDSLKPAMLREHRDGAESVRLLMPVRV
jgi:DNA polymerase-3 subunit beta